MNRTLLLSVALAGMLSACASVGPADAPAVNVGSRYVLQVEPGLDRIALAVHDTGLSATQQVALSALADRFAASRAEVIRVEAPAGDDPVAAQAAWSTRDALAALGVPAERVLVVAYDAPSPRAPVLAGFETLRASIPNCAAVQEAMASSFENRTSSGFGCSVTANLAAQISNPRDIVAPVGMAPADSGRGAKVYDAYRAGTPTSAPQETLIDGQIARAVD